MPKPNFFIVGAPKCGTTAMDNYLAQHPDIFIPDAKDIGFFGSDLTKPQYWTLKSYTALFDGWAGEKCIGESSVWYLYSKTAAQEIKSFAPESKIIVMLRNPVDMLYSLYHQLLFEGDEYLTSFELALAAETDRKRGMNLPNRMRGVVESLYYRETVRFSDQVERYFDVFGRDSVNVIIFDDFKQDTAAAYRQTLEFLDVDPDFSVDFVRINANKSTRNPLAKQVLREANYRLRRLGLRRISPLRKIYRSFHQLNTHYEERPAMSPELKHRLQTEFCPEVERLSNLLGRDLIHWVGDVNGQSCTS